MSKINYWISVMLLTISILNGQTKDKLLKVGDYAPDFVTTTVDGKTFKLSEQKGKFILLNFWGTWCVPCISEIPYLRDMQFLYGGKEFEIVSISVESEKRNIKSFGDSAGMGWTNISEYFGDGFQKTIANLYGVGTFPSNYLIDKNGKFVLFPTSYWKDNSGKIKVVSFQDAFIYEQISHYLGNSNKLTEYVTQSKGTLFSLTQIKANKVYLAGNFSRWMRIPMYYFKDRWVYKADLLPGTYQYKFIVDDRWIVDPANSNVVDDGNGNKNSQIIIK